MLTRELKYSQCCAENHIESSRRRHYVSIYNSGQSPNNSIIGLYVQCMSSCTPAPPLRPRNVVVQDDPFRRFQRVRTASFALFVFLCEIV